MSINVEKNIGDILGLCIITPSIIEDNRGFFMETFNERDLRANGLNMKFIQDNHVFNYQGVLRGLHVNINSPQGKLVRVIRGKIFDVVVDLRKDSITYRKWFSVELSSNNRKQLYIPEGFAHGYYVLSNQAEVLFKVTSHWIPNDEVGISWNSKELGIEWPITNGSRLILNEKDSNNKTFSEVWEGK